MRRDPLNLLDSSTTYRRWTILGTHLIFVLYTLDGSCCFFYTCSQSSFGIEKDESLPDGGDGVRTGIFSRADNEAGA